jgi:hypothetical protein
VPGTFVYIDALNFYYGALKGTPNKWVDLEALSRRLVPHDTIGLIRYFTANVKPLRPGDNTHERQAAYLRALETNPLIDIKRGHFRADVRRRALATAKQKVSSRELFTPSLLPDWALRRMLRGAAKRQTEGATVAQVVIREEKGSDVNLATYLLHDALVAKVVDKAIVITNDSDLEEPIRLVAQGGVPVGIVNPHRGPDNARLKAAATFTIPFRREVVAHCQLPNPMIGRNGKQIHKPREW